MKLDQARYNELTALRNITDQLAMEDWTPDLIVGVARGGLTPAVVLSHALGIPMISLQWSTRDHIVQQAEANQIIAGRQKVLVVDDICDSGLTMGELQEVLGGEGQDVRYAAMFLRHTSEVLPDYVGKVVNHDAWIEFSWELLSLELKK